MDPFITTAITRVIVVSLILAILFGALATWIWALGRLLRGQPLLSGGPILERRPPPWGLWTIVLVVAAYLVGGHYTVAAYVKVTREARPDKVAGPPEDADREKANGEPGPAAREPVAPAPPRPDESESLPHGLSPLELMALQGSINAVFILMLPVLARLIAGARLADFGLSLRRWRRQAAVGIVAVLFLMPIVYAVQFACIWVFQLGDEEREKFKHPLEKMLQEHFSPGVAALAFVTAVVLAPVFEELLFRGFLQSWLVKAFDRLAGRSKPSPTKTVADPMADPEVDHCPVPADPASEYWEAIEESEPPGRSEETTIALEKGDASSPQPRPASRTAAAIVLTSLIFAALHAAQWPAPIPLFLLALGLGSVYQRTGSLLAPICMHAVFNGFSTLMLFLVALNGGPPDKPGARPVIERATPVEKVAPAVPIVGPGPRAAKTGIESRNFLDDRRPD